MYNKKELLILGIESSCDETAAAIVADGRQLKSSVVASSCDIHARYGGVVPEAASRAHLEYIIPVIDQALEKANCRLQDIDAFAVCNGPGLAGSLFVGLSAAKTLAYVEKKPLIPVNHLEAHIAANYLENHELKAPFIAAIISGGHSHLALFKSESEFELFAKTRDDAPGECFDKIAREAGLGYPGGPAIDKAAQAGNDKAFDFPMPKFEDSYDFSFSGLKTAALNYINNAKMQAGSENIGGILNLADFSASFQKTVSQILLSRIDQAFKHYSDIDTLVLGGGVSANSRIRNDCAEYCEKHNYKFYRPSLSLCGDNAAMTASQAYFNLKAGKTAEYDLDAYTSI